MSQGSLAQSGWSIKEQVVQWLVPALGGSDGYIQILFDPVLPDEVSKMSWPQAGIKGNILGAGFTRYNVSYFNPSPYLFILPSPLVCLH